MTLTRVRTPYGPETTAAEVLGGIDLTGRQAIVTGAYTGIGRETARALAAAGATVTLAGRDIAAGLAVAEALRSETAGLDLEVAALDLADRRSIARFVDRWDRPLDMLVNNAGIMATPFARTAEGWELQLATNHLGPFALTTGLHGALAAAGDARVVMVSSAKHRHGELDFDDVNFQHRPYDPWLAFSQSKTANVLFAVEAAGRWQRDGIAVNALHPGPVRTAIRRHVAGKVGLPASFEPTSASIQWKSVAQGAATSVLLAGSPLVHGVTGRYFEDANEAELAGPGGRQGVARHAVDPVSAARLWQISVELLTGRYRPASASGTVSTGPAALAG